MVVGGTHCNFRRLHAEHGHVLVVAASHLIFRRLHPSQALITASVRNASMYTLLGKQPYPLAACDGYVRPRIRSLAER